MLTWYFWGCLTGFLIGTYLFEHHVRKGVNIAIVYLIQRTEKFLQRFDDSR